MKGMDVTNGVPGVNAPDPATYEEFWPYYVSQHLHPATRAIHVGATTTALAWGAAGIVLFNPLLLAASPVSFGHPLWSLRADFRQLRKFFTGRLEADVQRVRKALRLRPEQRTLADAGPRLRAA